ncbi:hypothetical protein MPTK1_6g10510 [Marchantia polymorpha subsp. ruderalis]|uniref:Uncharacterized protein n=2 Tax=Marchantia polymorpha TaxID=3197 RepID=A0AAF6BQL6_MARPO|nr:hypothetical protein MARPO_0016s0092 [Marchantia polymorpha]BBN14300.1 hypothetical protein Mp_6g10510 [Marchantia polymorpha subsp. ruderalis]|eukprot:PTQ45034.1 hypothetical protein MARPO_0016s0092 [Marchantia polymorpha]
MWLKRSSSSCVADLLNRLQNILLSQLPPDQECGTWYGRNDHFLGIQSLWSLCGAYPFLVPAYAREGLGGGARGGLWYYLYSRRFLWLAEFIA